MPIKTGTLKVNQRRNAIFFEGIILEKIMSNKSLILKTAMVLICVLLAAGGLGIASDAGPENMELKSSAGKKTARFPHRKHQENFACKECHHAKTEASDKSPYAEGMEIKKCIVCHNKDDMSNPQLNSFKLAAHGLCKECHKQNKDSAPTKCSGCHIK